MDAGEARPVRRGFGWEAGGGARRGEGQQPGRPDRINKCFCAHTHTHRTQETWQGCWWERKAGAVLCASENTDRHTAHSGAGCLVEETVRLLANCFVCSPRPTVGERFTARDLIAATAAPNDDSRRISSQRLRPPAFVCLPRPWFSRGDRRGRGSAPLQSEVAVCPGGDPASRLPVLGLSQAEMTAGKLILLK